MECNTVRKEGGLSVADTVASVQPLHERSMPLLAHLEELRKRIIFQFLGFLSALSCTGHSLTDCSLQCSSLLFTRYGNLASPAGWFS